MYRDFEPTWRNSVVSFLREWGLNICIVSIFMTAGILAGIVVSRVCPVSIVNTTTILNEQPDVIVEVVDPSLERYAEMWRREISRRTHNAVAILCHGGTIENGRWIVGAADAGYPAMPAQELVKKIQVRYPGRQVVLLSCNTAHLKLGIKGVLYSPSPVWCIPDRELTLEMLTNGESRRLLDNKNRWAEYPDAVGSIFEFVQE